jgi:alpha-beta hydrolase superfamily lysophospholipase
VVFVGGGAAAHVCGARGVCRGAAPHNTTQPTAAKGVCRGAAPHNTTTQPTAATYHTTQNKNSAPTRGVVILPGLGNNAADYARLADQLRARGLDVAVAQIARPDWGRNALALADAAWWRGTLQPRPAVDWYLTRVDAAVAELKRRVGDGAPLTMLTHSAGGVCGCVVSFFCSLVSAQKK